MRVLLISPTFVTRGRDTIKIQSPRTMKDFNTVRKLFQSRAPARKWSDKPLSNLLVRDNRNLICYTIFNIYHKLQDISANRINVESLLEQSQHNQFFYSSCMGIKGNIIVGIFLLHPHIFRKHKKPIPPATSRHQKSIGNPAAFDVASTRRLSLIPTPELLKNSNTSVVTHFVLSNGNANGESLQASSTGN